MKASLLAELEQKRHDLIAVEEERIRLTQDLDGAAEALHEHREHNTAEVRTLRQELETIRELQERELRTWAERYEGVSTMLRPPYRTTDRTVAYRILRYVVRYSVAKTVRSTARHDFLVKMRLNGTAYHARTVLRTALYCTVRYGGVSSKSSEYFLLVLQLSCHKKRPRLDENRSRYGISVVLWNRKFS